MSETFLEPRSQKSPTQLSPIKLYLAEIAKIPLLSPEEEFELAKDHFDRGSIEAAHRLVTSNLRLVVKIASEFRQAQNQLLDLIQQGNEGLMHAVQKFNPYKGVKLSSYAAWWIKAYILKFIMDNKSLVKLGTTAAQRKLFYNLRKEAEKLLREYERIDTKLLAERLDVKEEEVIEMEQRLKAPDLSLDAPLGGGDESGGSSRVSLFAHSDPDPEEMVEAWELREKFNDVLVQFKRTLKGRDLEIFELRMLAEEPKTLQEVGDLYGISRERARQIEARILQKLRSFADQAGLIDV